MMEAKQRAKKKENNERRLKDSLEFSDSSGKAIRERATSSIFSAVPLLSSLVNNTSRSGVAQFSSGARSSRLPSSASSFIFRLCFFFSSLLFLQQKAQAGKKKSNLRSIIVSFFCARPLFFLRKDFLVCLASHQEFCTIFVFGKNKEKEEKNKNKPSREFDRKEIRT